MSFAELTESWSQEDRAFFREIFPKFHNVTPCQMALFMPGHNCRDVRSLRLVKSASSAHGLSRSSILSSSERKLKATTTRLEVPTHTSAKRLRRHPRHKARPLTRRWSKARTSRRPFTCCSIDTKTQNKLSSTRRPLPSSAKKRWKKSTGSSSNRMRLGATRRACILDAPVPKLAKIACVPTTECGAISSVTVLWTVGLALSPFWTCNRSSALLSFRSEKIPWLLQRMPSQRQSLRGLFPSLLCASLS